MNGFDHRKELARIDHTFNVEQMKRDRKFLLLYLLLVTVVLAVNLVGGATSIGLLRIVPWLSAGYLIGISYSAFLKYTSIRKRVQRSEDEWGWSEEMTDL